MRRNTSRRIRARFAIKRAAAGTYGDFRRPFVVASDGTVTPT